MSEPDRNLPRPELSRPYTVARLSGDGEPFRFEANAEERAGLARRFDLIDVPSLEAEGIISMSDHGRRARVEGIVRAQVVQSCVVTLEPVPGTVEESFVRTFTSSPTHSEREAVVDLDSEDPPDPIVGGVVDVGEVVAEELGLALDPYPRAIGAELPIAPEVNGDEPANVIETVENTPKSPFEALKRLVKKP